jgi:hypothetical protein
MEGERRREESVPAALNGSIVSPNRVFVSFTVSINLDIIPRIRVMASSAVPRQQMTKSSA